jgi:DNA repair exonuclease SbcCD ATPase subunit
MSRKHTGHDPKGEGDERLMQLFWNRAALKKEFRRLREQRYRLEETLKHQQEATRGVEARMRALEKLFANPEAGFNAIVYYQLRNLWNTCAAELKKFATELYQQREERERRQHMTVFERERNQRLSELADEMQDLTAEISRLRATLKQTHAKMESVRGVFGYFKRRPLQAELETARMAITPLQLKYDQLGEQQSSVAAQHPPEFQGLGIQGKRIANLGVIALAQYMQQYYSEKGYARMARDAVVMPIEEVRYGTREQCTRLMEEIPRAIAGIKSDPGFSAAVKRGAQELFAVVKYLTDEDTIPRAESLDQEGTQAPRAEDARSLVLTQDCWDVYSALIR